MRACAAQGRAGVQPALRGGQPSNFRIEGPACEYACAPPSVSKEPNMNPFSFRTVPHVLIEAGVARRLGEVLAQRFAVGRVCVVTDAPLYRSGLLDGALASLQAGGWQVQVISDVQADPPEHVVEAICGQAQSQGTDLVLGFGGGSSMDVAKLVAVRLGGD